MHPLQGFTNWRAYVTQKEAAEALGVSKNTISNWEHNRTPIPKWALDRIGYDGPDYNDDRRKRESKKTPPKETDEDRLDRIQTALTVLLFKLIATKALGVDKEAAAHVAHRLALALIKIEQETHN